MYAGFGGRGKGKRGYGEASGNGIGDVDVAITASLWDGTCSVFSWLQVQFGFILSDGFEMA